MRFSLRSLSAIFALALFPVAAGATQPLTPSEVQGVAISAPEAEKNAATAAASATFIGIRRFTSQEYSDWLISNGTTGSDITLNQGRVFLTDYRFGHIVRINSASTAANGDIVESRLINPDGDVAGSLSTTFNSSTNCWTGIGTTCNVTTILFGFFYSPRRPCGTWTCEVYFNNNLVSANDFEMVGYILEVTDGDGQEGLQGSSLPDALRLQVLGFDNEPVPGERVTFSLTSRPNGAKGGGLTDAYYDPPSGTTATSFLNVADGDGFAQTFLELGNKAGDYLVGATSTYYDDRYPPLFTETAEKLTIGVITMNAIEDVALPGINDPVFEADIQDGAIVEIEKKPFGIAAGLPFTLELFLAGDPEQPAWEPTVQWKYRIGSSGKSTRGTEFTGWTHQQTILLEPSDLAGGGGEILNEDFGPTTMSFSFTFLDETGTRVNTQATTMDVRIFFQKDGDDDGDGVPNWFQYWNQTSAGGDAQYDATIAAPDFGYTDLSSSAFNVFIGPLAATSGVLRANGQMVSGIDCFATTVRHELQHVEDFSVWWPDGYTVVDHVYDQDSDRVPDGLEPGLGFDPMLLDTDNDGITDSEESAYDAETEWAIGSADPEDWAYPGKQTEPAYAASPSVVFQAPREHGPAAGTASTPRLGPASPNPFRSRTEVALSLAQPGVVRWRVVDVRGRTVRSLESSHEAGRQLFTWDGRDDRGLPLAHGIYFLHVDAPGLSETRKVALLR